MKKCIKCGKIKTFSEFNKNKLIRDGFHYYCKLCRKIQQQKIRQNRIDNNKCVRCNNVNNSDSPYCIGCYNERNNYEKSEHGRQLNKERSEKYRERHKGSSYYQKYLSNRYNNDIQFKLASCLRSRLYQAIKRDIKAGSAVGDLGCSIVEFKKYLESQFQPKMSWENYGHGPGYTKWNIDHIIPLSTVDLTDREQFLKVCHYTNLRPMWQCENISRNKKSK